MAKTGTEDELGRDLELSQRIADLVEQHTLRGLARKLDVPNQNILRYTKGTQPPASFCRKLVERLGVNPAWLLTGQGTPSLTDVPSITPDTTTNLLELVQAMNAMSQMRLGALTGKPNAKMLRELNTTLKRHNELQDKLNQHSRIVFKQVLGHFSQAIREERSPKKAEPFRKAADQIAELCKDDALRHEYKRLRAHYAHMTGDDEESLDLATRFVAEGFFVNGAIDQQGCFDLQKVIAILFKQLRLREAQKMADAGLILAKQHGRQWPPYYALLEIAGLTDIEAGELQRGLARLTQALPHIPSTWRIRNTNVGIALANTLLGVMSFQQAIDYAKDSPLSHTLAPLALWNEDESDLAAALKLIKNNRGNSPERAKLHESYLKTVKAALNGSEPVSEESFLENRSDSEQSFYATITSSIVAAQAAFISDDNRKTHSLFKKSQALFSQMQDNTSLPVTFQALHYRNQLRIAQSSKSRKSEDLLQAQEFFQTRVDAGYVLFNSATRHEPTLSSERSS